MQTMIDINGTDIRDVAYYNEIAVHRGWHVAAHHALTRLANTGKPFTADDLRELLGHDVQPHHPNVIGSFFRVARKDGLIRPTGKFVEARTPSRHGAAIRQWVGTMQQAA
ncbi:hypothetical protein H0194_04760 [Corynebacterium incognita]|uniref:Uncharacterized protein n=1 Tax=Corynebacterium incognita TaxID=2754725 RepID=A0A7G7CRS5_9CORY|nr:hypothetical protein [Corynebacterium incognita]QNE90291.1 hypothetical protein H0194_04760 [Corynebacterium incognita]